MTFLTLARQQIPMQHTMGRQPKTIVQASLRRRRRRSFEAVSFALAPSVLAALLIPAQTLVSQVEKSVPQAKTIDQPVKPGSEAIVERQPVSVSPAEQPPNTAKVSWDSRGLKIEASNSSLNQILHQVATETGAKLEGLTEDQRVFGSYGPGPTSDVLLKLLDGSGYNVLMIGGRDANDPLEIVLSTRLHASPQTAANNPNRSNSEQRQPEPQQNSSLEPPHPQTIQDPFSNGEPPRDPKEFMQEILQRQQKIDQQQQQQDKQNNLQQ